jgi:hypothetical protein
MQAPGVPPSPSPSVIAGLHKASLPLSQIQTETVRDKQIERDEFALEQKKFEYEQERDRLQRHLELQKLELERVKVHRDSQKSGRDGVIKFAEIGIRSLLILNGGAALALLAFVGHGSSAPGSKFVHSEWAGVFAWFAFGAACAVVTAGLSYVAQAVNFDSPRRAPAIVRRYVPTATRAKVFDTVRGAALAASFLGMFAFAGGLCAAYSAMNAPTSRARQVRTEVGAQFAMPWQAEHEGFWRDRPGARNRP